MYLSTIIKVSMVHYYTFFDREQRLKVLKEALLLLLFNFFFFLFLFFFFFFFLAWKHGEKCYKSKKIVQGKKNVLL